MRKRTILIVLGLVAGVLLTPATAQAGFGIEPGKVYIDGLYPGAEADVQFTIYNHYDYETAFKVRAREPDYTKADYEPLPYLDWITITPDEVAISSRGQSEVLVVIIMPEDADYSGRKSEVWISFMEREPPGMTRIELCSRLLISTRTEATNETPAVSDNGSVSITVETEEAESVFPWAIFGSVIGVLVVGAAVFFLVKRRQHV